MEMYFKILNIVRENDQGNRTPFATYLVFGGAFQKVTNPVETVVEQKIVNDSDKHNDVGSAQFARLVPNEQDRQALWTTCLAKSSKQVTFLRQIRSQGILATKKIDKLRLDKGLPT
ncbi:hypothetical protein QE152_g7797 [Popillia japonica]|uniref:Uncharacterized protein n=1 Tax=Popillia japonica TaxID=7064 RepID=A0AAW1M998_POPJA